MGAGTDENVAHYVSYCRGDDGVKNTVNVYKQSCNSVN